MIRVFYRPCGKTHKEQHTAAYELLYAAAAVCGLPTGPVEKTEEGKPYFPEAPETYFSLSHTDGYAVCAIGDVPCGIDIERKRPISKRIRDRFLDGATEEEALCRWTERESYGKLDGRGFFTEGWTSDVTFFHYTTLPDRLMTLCVPKGVEVAPAPELL